MRIIKKNGKTQEFLPNKIHNRIKSLSSDLKVDVDEVFKRVIPEINDGLTTTEIDEILAFKIADLIQYHYDYSTLASRVLITRQAKRINREVEDVDMNYDFFGTVTFLKNYSIKDDKGSPIELPSMMYNRIAEYLGESEEEIKEFSEELKSKRISVATPIMTNAGTSRKALISCNITTNIEDSREGILSTLENISIASGEGAGIGLCIDNVRSKETLVSTFKAPAGGVVRYCDMVQSHMRFFKQGTRSGSAALYLSVWHKDILDFLSLRLPIGDEKLRTRDLFTAVTINDNFMKALINDEDWYLFCPHDIVKAGLTPLQDLWGNEYEAEYNKAVELGLGKKVSPKTIWDAIIRSCVESGTPYIFFKDNANRKNMQDNIGTIKSLNLCIEFTGVSKPNYTSQCCLGLIPVVSHNSLESISKSTKILTKLLNRVIDKNQWSDRPSAYAGEDQRAIGIGIAGLADYLAKNKISFTSDEAKELNKNISETIYKSAVEQSHELALKDGSYPAWEDSKYSKGETYIKDWSPNSESLPMRNSLLVCLMPSAGSSILLSVNEGFEPFSSNLFVRNTGVGEFVVINKWLLKELEELNLWNDNTRSTLVKLGGSIQDMDLPSDLKERYRTVWEIPQRDIIDMASDRAQFIDQSQSMNLYFTGAEYGRIAGALRYGWEKGLKTGAYYTKTQRKLEKPTRLADTAIVEVTKQKPANSPYECFGCSS